MARAQASAPSSSSSSDSTTPAPEPPQQPQSRPAGAIFLHGAGAAALCPPRAGGRGARPQYPPGVVVRVYSASSSYPASGLQLPVSPLACLSPSGAGNFRHKPDVEALEWPWGLAGVGGRGPGRAPRARRRLPLLVCTAVSSATGRPRSCTGTTATAYSR